MSPGLLRFPACLPSTSVLSWSPHSMAPVLAKRVLEIYSMFPPASSLPRRSRRTPRSGPSFPTVQCTFFDKSADNNWLVALHQDLSIPIQERVAHPDCSGWSKKEGVLYVQPPVAVLESLVAVRAHLDDCGSANGPLRVVPGSHRHGRLSPEAARALREQRGAFECIARRGDVLAMRPLLLHSSSKAQAKAPRRVLHFLFGPGALPCGLKWHRAV